MSSKAFNARRRYARVLPEKAREGPIRSVVVSLLAASLIACAGGGAITGVTVRDDRLDILKQLAPPEVARFEQQWRTRSEVDASVEEVGGRPFVLDVGQEKRSSRWLYRTTGFAQVLSVKKTAVYKLAKPEAFNEIIGAGQ